MAKDWHMALGISWSGNVTFGHTIHATEEECEAYAHACMAADRDTERYHVLIRQDSEGGRSGWKCVQTWRRCGVNSFEVERIIT